MPKTRDNICSKGLRQLVQQRLRLFQVGGVEPLGEPAVDGSEEVAGFDGLALGMPEAGEAGRGAEFPGLGLLAPCKFERVRIIGFGLGFAFEIERNQKVASSQPDLNFRPTLTALFGYRLRPVELADTFVRSADSSKGASKLCRIVDP